MSCGQRGLLYERVTPDLWHPGRDPPTDRSPARLQPLDGVLDADG